MRANVPWEEVRRRHKRRCILIAIVGLGILIHVGLSLFGEAGVFRHYSMIQNHQKLSEELKKLTMWNEIYEAEIDKIENNPVRLEELARRELGMARENETVYRFFDP